MRSLFLAASLLLSAHASAAVVLEVDMADGGRLLLHDTAGACVGDAQRMEWVSHDMKRRVPGCWRIDAPSQAVHFILLDAQGLGMVPVSAVRKARTT